METPKLFRHNLQDQVLGWIEWNKPMRMTFVHHDGTQSVFENVVKMEPMKTGCYVYFTTSDVVYVVPPGNHRYIKQEPMQ